ncbi:deoxycytidine triphosphate deaminase [Candidatus Mancarchaeum acidiphilum]|uniref:dCTP deaminase n=1 Tax=Candidatus Mancarchaeum acidiphilum TaxID=1920749 RepID=A0A218NN85_9ARCH|nr:dCTP deaminase [Candidatus Mancarchaeum acidiphilum]ASI13904.1 deoxycytidine triphosphate deaminase [Candidatus Mancarchaeum acidiphilum]
MILSDFDIKSMVSQKRLTIEPLTDDSIRENGIDFRLADEVARHKAFDESFVLDPTDENMIKGSYKLDKTLKEIVINPHEQVLLSTYESISMPDDVAGFVELRSTWARHGLSMPPTIIDAGFNGTITLEVVNNAPYKILLRPGQRFAHIILEKLNNKTGKVYNGNYNMQKGIKLPQVLGKN